MSKFNFLLFFTVSIILIAAESSPSPSPSPSSSDLIAKACKNSRHETFCADLLNSDPSSAKAGKLKDLAYIALRHAEKNASVTSFFIKQALQKKDFAPSLQQALADCSDHYISAVELLEDSINALVSDAYADIAKWGKAAVADLDGCDANIKEEGGVAPELASMNVGLRQLVNTALSVAHVAAN